VVTCESINLTDESYVSSYYRERLAIDRLALKNSAATVCLNAKPGKTTCFYGSILGSCFLLSVEVCNSMGLEIIPLTEY